MKNIKQILALIGIILLVALYASTLVFAIIDDPRTMMMLGLSIILSIFIPTIIWVMGIFFKISHKKDSEDKDSDE